MDRLLAHALADPIRLAREKGCSIVGFDCNDPEVQAADRAYRRREARANSCVLCFSRDRTNPLMWTFYAQEHQGLCLGFSTEGELLRHARPVVYTHSPTDVLHLEDPTTRNDPLSFCKSTDWQFENEWRVCLPERGPKRVDLANEKLVSVHIGYRMKEPKLQELVLALRKSGYKHQDTKLFRMERIHFSFRFCERPIKW